MSTFRSPVGPQPPRVYWRRRLLVGIGVIAVIVIVVLIFARPGTGGVPANTTSLLPTSAATASPGSACSAANLTLVALTDKVTYAAAEQPKINMKLTNTGTTACTVNMGSTKQELIITSGSERIWDSKDCQTGAVDSEQTLKPGDSLSTPPIAWNRTRSSTSTCSATNPPQVTAGGASYHLGAVLGDQKSKDTVQFLLN